MNLSLQFIRRLSSLNVATSKTLFNHVSNNMRDVANVRFLRSVRRNLPNPTTQTTKSIMETPENPTKSPLLQPLKSDDEPSEAKETLDLLLQLYRSIKQQNLNLENNRADVEYFCDKIYKNIRKFNVNEVVQVFNILSYFRIPSNTVVMQATLQMIRLNINNLSTRQIVHVHLLLTKQEKTPLGEAIRQSLPIVFKMTARYQLADEDIEMLSSAFYYAILNKCGKKTIALINALIEKNIENMTESAAKRIIRAVEDNLTYNLNFCKRITFEAVRTIGKAKNKSYKEVKSFFYELFPRKQQNQISQQNDRIQN